MKKTIRDFDFNDKTALVRVDFNVPLKDGVVTGDDRIVKAIPTIEYLIENGAKVVLMSHLGRPKGEYKEDLSLEPVAKRASELLKKDVKFIPSKEVVDEEVISQVKELQKGEKVKGKVLLCEGIGLSRQMKSKELDQWPHPL